MLTVKRYATINDIDERVWDSILKPGQVYNKHHFIRMVEESKIENAQFFYLLFFDDQQLVGSTVLSAFNISLDLFISNNNIVRRLKSIFPRLFEIKLLVCGLPASFGQLNLAVIHPKYAGQVASLVVNEMKTLAKKLKTSLLAIKELRENETRLFSQFYNEGFFLANSIPYMSMNVRWKCFEEYLASFRHPYRRRILRSLNKLQLKKPVIHSSIADVVTGKPVLVLSTPEEEFSAGFYSLYLQVMQRTPTKLETLNLKFFEKLFNQKDSYHLLNLTVKEKIISSAILKFNNDTLYFMLVGREHERDEHDSYFNLMYAIIALGIERKCKKINLGQTAYRVKQCVGATAEAEYIYFASRNKLMHVILKSLRKIIFPELKLPTLNVFREKHTESYSHHTSKEIN